VIASTAPGLRVVLYEGAGGRPFDGARRLEMLRALLEKGYAVTCVRNGAGGSVSGVEGGALLVLGSFEDEKPPQVNAPESGVTVLFRHTDGADVPGVLAVVDSVAAEAQVRKPGGWKPWFPVIDFGRCTNCMQCLSFCLFDVYGVSKEGKIQVQNENNCKTDCPACSRVCPEVAILFPKYRFGPINGDEVSTEDMRREAMKVDISALLGGDIYSALRDRSEHAKSRFSKERDEDRALKERQRCFEKLQQAMSDVPAEVLASLPAPDEIMAKAKQAKARADAALQTAAAAAQAEPRQA
jgi:NAD-dependent dihydropyrimidine dehydrogenase PreA subunit